MGGQSKAAIAAYVVAKDLTFADLRAALAAGWRDFLGAPLFGLFFAAIYVAAGLLIYYGLFERGELFWLIPVAAGFPLLAPFIAVGLYEVSRRRENGLPLNWRAILGALRGQGEDQIMSMGAILFVGFSFWMILAHGIFAIFASQAGSGGESLALFRTLPGIMMLLVGGGVGALMALAFYAVTVMSLPMLVEHDVDFITAIIVSLATLRSNKAVMLCWGIIIAIFLFVAMLPFFLGLLIILPLLAHATWHLYRRAVDAPVPA